MAETKGLIIAATRSGGGKTSVCLALAAALARRGLTVQCCKIGPDFIDPGHHRVVSSRPSYNLDSWMNGPEGVLRTAAHALRREPAPDVLLVEGVMGLFDGAHAGPGNGSTAETALLLNLPVLLLLDASGMAQSVAALAEGFVRRQPALRFAGLACTGVGGPGHQAMLREALHDAPAPLLGLLTKKDAPALPARRLGLVTAHEAPLSPEEQDRLAGLLEEQLDIDALLRDLPAVDLPPVPPPASKTGGRRVAVAFDAAFCFLYPDLPEMLEESGAHCAFFSPLEDAGLPEAELLYLPGGYPELFAARLAANASLREALRAFAASGRPVYGECGGYIYLMESVRADGVEYPMSGLLPLRCDAGAQRAALGYRQVRPAGPGFFAPNEEKPVGRGHEFHYARLTHRPSGLPALWLPEDRTGKALAPEGTLSGNVAGSWVHLAPHGAKALWNNFLRAGART